MLEQKEHPLKRLVQYLLNDVEKMTSILTNVQMKDRSNRHGGERVLEFPDGTKIHLINATLKREDDDKNVSLVYLNAVLYFNDDTRPYPVDLLAPHGVYLPNDGLWNDHAYAKLDAFLDKMLAIQCWKPKVKAA